VRTSGRTVQSRRNLLTRASLLERRAHIERFAFCGQHQREQPLPAPPVNAGKVIERSSFHQQESIDAAGFHQLARFFLTPASFLQSDGPRLVLH
jgi:hypothetical protein